MKQLIIIIIFSLGSIASLAQKSYNFHSVNNIGVAWGATGEGFQLQTINGVKWKDISTGIGVGLDYYYGRTLPLFADIRMNISKKRITPFVFADLGTNLPIVINDPQVSGYKSTYKAGLYFDAGAGYQFAISKLMALNISFSYTQKKYKEEREYTGIVIDFPPYDRSIKDQFDYTLRRFSLKAGIAF
jgi:hypothetical protein